MIKKCVVCGKEFSSPPSSKKITCSSQCQRERRSKMLLGHTVREETKTKIRKAAKERGYTDNLKRGTPAAQLSEKAGKNEKNSSAKSYVLIAPDSRRFSVTNLRNWVRNNPSLFNISGTEQEIDKVCKGFYTIKKNIKRNSRGKTYKGWTIEDWDDRKNVDKLKEVSQSKTE